MPKANNKTLLVTLIQRFGSALNLNIHFHMLFLYGVCVDGTNGSVWFRWVKAPSSAELTQLAHTIAQRIGRFLEREGLLERGAENSYLAGDAADENPKAKKHALLVVDSHPVLNHLSKILASNNVPDTQRVVV